MKYWREFATRHPDAANGLLVVVLLAIFVPIAGHYFYWRFVAVFVIGALVGTGELVARYRDAPQSALWTLPAILYLMINAVGAVVALYVVQTFHYAESPDPLKTRITHIFLAGFGAMAFFRSSVFTVRVGDQDISIGPVAFLQVVLRATDRAVDRIRAKARAEIVTTIMANLSFDRTYPALPAFCLQLMQNVSAEEGNDIGSALKSLKGSAEFDNETKVRNLGLLLLNVVGESVLRTAVTRIGQQLQKTIAVTIDNAPPTLAAGHTLELLATCTDSSKAPVADRRPAWSSDDPTIATVTASGHLAAVKGGNTVIRAKSDDAEAVIPLTVTPTLAVTPALTVTPPDSVTP